MPYLVPLLASGLALLFGCAVEAATGYGLAVVALPVMVRQPGRAGFTDSDAQRGARTPRRSFAAGLASGFMGNRDRDERPATSCCVRP